MFHILEETFLTKTLDEMHPGKSPATVRIPAPEFGQHTEEVLLEHGYTWEDIPQFKAQGAFA